MDKRAEAAGETRQRIVEATVALHGSQGIFGTSWKDIARAADVSVGTVYKHFASLEELVPACGELLMQRIRPPAPGDADGVIGDASDREERLRRVANALFEFYERGGDHLEIDLRERKLPAMREWEQYLRDVVSHFVRRALDDPGLEEEVVQAIAALCDFPTFRSMRRRGITLEGAVAHTVAMAAGCAVGPHPKHK
jgi:AcrR family transcriptional regulator